MVWSDIDSTKPLLGGILRLTPRNWGEKVANSGKPNINYSVAGLQQGVYFVPKLRNLPLE